jgi:hypothetical protein
MEESLAFLRKATDEKKPPTEVEGFFVLKLKRLS